MTTKEAHCLIAAAQGLPDAREGLLSQAEVTLADSNVLAIDIPAGSRGFRATTSSSGVVFAIDEDPETISTNPAALSVGNTLSDLEREVRLVDSSASQLRIKGAAADVILIEFWG